MNKTILKEGLVLILIFGLILFGTGYFLSDEIAYQGLTIVGGDSDILYIYE